MAFPWHTNREYYLVAARCQPKLENSFEGLDGRWCPKSGGVQNEIQIFSGGGGKPVWKILN